MNLKNFALLWGYIFPIILFSQNDLDALRYSRTGIGGSPRFIAMGGAMGALGGDLSCASYNPAGLGIFRKGEMVFSGGLRFVNNIGESEGLQRRTNDAYFRFSNFGIAFFWASEKDPTRRNIFSFSNNQIANFNNQIQLGNPETENSIAKDMLNLANSKGGLFGLNSAYENLGYNTYVLDYDSASGKFFSFVDMGGKLAQSRALSTKGRMNEINISLAQSHDDNFYIGASLGIPRVKFESTMIHSESDTNDSMRVTSASSSSFSTSYVVEPPFFWSDLLGFNSLRYTEFFKTEGYGINLKLGALFRVNQMVRVGAYFHSPTFFRLTDTYWYKMESTFDQNKDRELESTFPPSEEEGGFEYRVQTPMRFGLNAGFVFGKVASLGIDYEGIGYDKAKLGSEDPKDFEGVNAVIRNKYKYASNLRIGGELNTHPVMVRAGYALNGSPFGGFLKGDFDRHTLSLGLGLRTKSNYFYDITWYRSSTKEDYYMFSTIDLRSRLTYVSSALLFSVGIKF